MGAWKGGERKGRGGGGEETERHTDRQIEPTRVVSQTKRTKKTKKERIHLFTCVLRPANRYKKKKERKKLF